MNITKKMKIIIIVSISLLYTIIMFYVITGQNHETNYKPDYETYVPSLQNQLIVDFDGNTKLRGAQVIASVKKYYTNKELTEVSVCGVNYSVNAGAAAGKIGNLSNAISITDNYTANLVRDTGTGKTVIGIAFTKN